MPRLLRPLVWIGSSRREYSELSDQLQNTIGYALYIAQLGKQHRSAKVLKGFGDAGVLEIIENDLGGTYRAVYTVRFATAIYMLHVFQKKSKHGIATPKHEMEIVRRRLREAELHYREHQHEH